MSSEPRFKEPETKKIDSDDEDEYSPNKERRLQEFMEKRRNK